MAVGMGGAMLFYQVFVPLLLVATPSSSEEKFGLTGGSIVFQAKPMPENVSNIIWKHNKDKAAEWFEGDPAPIYYDIFKDVTTLDMQTWALTISNLHPRFNGKYSAEVNNKDPTQFVTLAVLGPVSKPEITMDCIETEINCTLTCQGKEVEFPKYTWADDIDEWSGSKLTVKRRDHDVVYTCTFSNPVSSASSPGTVKKYVPPPSPPSGPGGIILGIIGGIITGLIIYACIRLLLFIKQGKSLTDLRTMTCRDRCRIFIPCIKERKTSGDEEMQKPGTPPVPPGQDQSPAADPMLPGVSVTPPVPSGEAQSSETVPLLPGVSENNEAHGDEEMTNNGGVKPPEVKTDSSREGNPTANGPGSTAEGENNEAHGDEEMTNNGDENPTEVKTDSSHEGNPTQNGPGSKAEGENNEAHGGKESPEKTNTDPTSEVSKL